MPSHDYKIQKNKQDNSKRRPSIELSPTLEKPVFLITKNLNGMHILHLIEELQKNKIAYQMQQQTETLGFTLNQRFFVIVDNKYGEVTLGPDFGSILMTIIGYPRLGKNKKNKYFQNPCDIIAFFNEFKNNSDISKQTRELIQHQCQDMIIETEPVSKLKGKIELKSITQYKGSTTSEQNTGTFDKSMFRKQEQMKLIILQDKTDKQFSQICSILKGKANQQMIQAVQNLEEVRKKTLFHTNKTKIYYLVNEVNSKQLIKCIFLGQVIVFKNNNTQPTLKNITDQAKIYAIAYEKQQLVKILMKIGLKTSSQKDISSLQPKKQKIQNELQKIQTNLEQSKNSPFLLKAQSNIKQKPVQVSKIEPIISNISPTINETNDMNTSIISQSSSCSKKIKRLKPAKQKITQQMSKNAQLQKQNKELTPKNQIHATGRKKTLKKQQTPTSQKSKKNITFNEQLVIQTTQRKVIRSLSKVQPQQIRIESQDDTTNTQNQYYVTSQPQQKRNSCAFKNSFTSSGSGFGISKQSFLINSKYQREGTINGLFYRQFVPKFQSIVQLIKMKPQTILLQHQKVGVYQQFLYIKQFDRMVRKLKNKLKERNQYFQQYNFIVFLLQDEVSQLQQYCKQKNQTYDQQEIDFQSTFKTSKYSCLSKGSSRINIYLFIDSNKLLPDETVDCGRFRIFKSRLLNDPSDSGYNMTLKDISCKLIKNGNLINNQLIHS